MTAKAWTTAAIALSTEPLIYVTVLDGKWLLENGHTTPSWRAKDPKLGFQRIVKEDRAKEIARTVLDRGRTFPNAIILATNQKNYAYVGATLELTLPANAKMLVVDGQHRLWAQHYSKISGRYPAVIHMGLSEKDMAELFLEINDKQRRVASSLRWDLVRLVQKGDIAQRMTADIIYELVTRPDSPFESVRPEEGPRKGVRIDMTGDDAAVDSEFEGTWIKQGSLAPEIRTLLNRTHEDFNDDLEGYVDLFIRFFASIQSLDKRDWSSGKSIFLKARVMRALIRVLADIVADADGFAELTAGALRERFSAIDKSTLTEEAVRKAQGSAGVADLYKELRRQVFAEAP